MQNSKQALNNCMNYEFLMYIQLKYVVADIEQKFQKFCLRQPDLNQACTVHSVHVQRTWRMSLNVGLDM